MNEFTGDLQRLERSLRYVAVGAGLGTLVALPLLFGVVRGAPFLVVACAAVLAVVGYFLARREERLLGQAFTDPHTGLPNARTFEGRVAEELDRAVRHRHPLALLVAEFDCLRFVVDQHGDGAAEQLVRAIAKCIRQTCRSTDVVARRTRDEFVVLAPYTTAEEAIVLGERLHAALAELEGALGLGVELTPSIGIAELTQTGAPRPGSLAEAADQALMLSKASHQPLVAMAGGQVLYEAVDVPPPIDEPAPRAPIRRGTSSAIRVNEIVHADGEKTVALSAYCPSCDAWQPIEGKRRSDWSARLLRSHEGLPHAPLFPSDARVADLMTRQVVCVEAEMSADALNALFLDREIGAAPVLDADRRLIGIIAKSDLLRNKYDPLEGATVADLMMPIVFKLSASAAAVQAAALMAYEGVNRIVVVSDDGDAVVGMLSASDLLRCVAQQSGYVVPTQSEREQIAPVLPTLPTLIERPVVESQPSELVPVVADHQVIMIVDDDADLRNDFAEILREEGYTVVTAANGFEALAALRSGRPPSLILLDLQMPIMNGWALHAELAKDPTLGRIPLVLLSGMEQLSGRTARLDVDGFLAKPVALNKLLGTVKQYLC